MRRPVRDLAIGAALSLVVTGAEAGSFLQSDGDFNYSVGLGYIHASREWDSQGDLHRLLCRNEYVFNSHYLEYGYSYYYTLFGGTNLAQSRCGNESTTGVGDVRIGLRGRLDPSRNHRAWQVELTLPVSAEETGRTRLGCGAFGIAPGVAIKEDVHELLTLGAEASAQFWEAPLSHQAEARATAAGRLGSHSNSPWSWNADLSGHAPLDERAGNPGESISDCGTLGRSVRGVLAIGYRVGSGRYLQCGAMSGLWGEDTTRRVGFSCAYSHRFKP